VKKCVIAFIAVTAIWGGTPASGASPQILTWTGLYVGLNAGGIWSKSNSIGVVSTPLQGFGDGITPGSHAANEAAGATGGVAVGHKTRFIGGGQIGYNWQFAPAWLAGFEADIQGVSSGGSDGALNTTVGPFAFVSAGEIINTQITSSRRIDYLGTVRGRLGYLWAPALLVYGTGGLAYGGVKAGTSIVQSNNDCVLFPGDCVAPNAATSGSTSQTRAGWAAGGGFEWMFSSHWSAKAEYLYYDLGGVTFNNGQLLLPNTSCGSCGAGPAIVASESTVKFKGSIARLGISYHF
jgi:outer membrane immunogenic protein